MTFGVFLPVLICFPSHGIMKSIKAGSLVIFLFGLWDDIRELNYGMKFLGQLIAALIVIVVGEVQITNLGNLVPEGIVLPVSISIPLTLVTIIGVTNAINLHDGLDGLAGGFIFLCFTCISYIAYNLGLTLILALSIAIVGAVFGFLRFNVHPARIFMGDLGSQLLGFLAITLSLYICQCMPAMADSLTNHRISPLFPLLLLGFPVLDTLTVMLNRMVKGRSPFKADKTHYHHRLMKMGMTHGEAVFTINLIQVVMAATAFALRYQSEILILFTYIVFAVVINGLFYMLRKWKKTCNQERTLSNRLNSVLTNIKEKHLAIKFFYGGLYYCLSLFIVFLFLIPRTNIGYSLYLIFGGLNLVMIVQVINNRFIPHVMTICFVVLAPIMLYTIEFNPNLMLSGILKSSYHTGFVVIGLLTILTLKFTRRNKNTNKTYFCFFIFFICLHLMTILLLNIENCATLTVMLHLILLLATYKVILSEIRKESILFFNSVTVIMFVFLIVSKLNSFFMMTTTRI